MGDFDMLLSCNEKLDEDYNHEEDEVYDVLEPIFSALKTPAPPVLIDEEMLRCKEEFRDVISDRPPIIEDNRRFAKISFNCLLSQSELERIKKNGLHLVDGVETGSGITIDESLIENTSDWLKLCLEFDTVVKLVEYFGDGYYPSVVEDGDPKYVIRQKAIQSMLKVCGELGLNSCVMWNAIIYIDRLLSLKGEIKAGWPLTCIILAVKLLDSDDMVKFSTQEAKIQEAEMEIISLLEGNLQPITPFTFLSYYGGLLEISSDLICDKSQSIVPILQDARLFSFKPWEIALAIVLDLCPVIEWETVDETLLFLKTEKVKVKECISLINKAKGEGSNG